MRTTIPQAVSRRHVKDDAEEWANREVVPFMQQARSVLNRTFSDEATLTTAATGAWTTIYTTEALPQSSAWRIVSLVLGRADGGRAALGQVALFYRDTGAAIMEGTVSLYTIRNPVGLDMRSQVSGNGIVVQVKDDGVLTVAWRVLIELQQHPLP